MITVSPAPGKYEIFLAGTKLFINNSVYLLSYKLNLHKIDTHEIDKKYQHYKTEFHYTKNNKTIQTAK